MKVKRIETPRELFAYLEQLQNQGGYIFRGQPNIQNKLIPYAFREDILAKRIELFPVKPAQIQSWYKHKKIIECINICLKSKYNISSELPSEIQRIFDLYIHVMRYNYFLSEYLEKHPQIISEEDKNFLAIRPKHFWTQEKNFIWIIENTLLRWIARGSLDGKILIEAHPEQGLTGMDETFPQHYGLPTAALDWTTDPYIALYFALGKDKIHLNKELNFYTCSSLQPEYFSIFCYSQLKEEDSPIYVKNKSSTVYNLRIERQKGVFTYFSNIYSFYFIKNKFPSIQFYDNLINEINPTFELIKLAVKADLNSRDDFRKILNEKQINEDNLMPPLSLSS